MSATRGKALEAVATKLVKELAPRAQEYMQAHVSERNIEYDLDIPESLLATPLPNKITVWIYRGEVVALTFYNFTTNPLHLSSNWTVGWLSDGEWRVMPNHGQAHAAWADTIRNHAGGSQFKAFGFVRTNQTQYDLRTRY